VIITPRSVPFNRLGTGSATTAKRAYGKQSPRKWGDCFAAKNKTSGSQHLHLAQVQV
jgi:hypothetical protein